VSISREEALKIAYISRISLEEQEIEPVLKQLTEVLEYAQRVQDLATELDEQPSYKNINVMREDVVASSYPEIILSRAPEREENYFVVPRILDTK
jgi:aspartyl-tRNA(Asn)/glutamyl-tRNA(Gln) amidotransferase subunit C